LLKYTQIDYEGNIDEYLAEVNSIRPAPIAQAYNENGNIHFIIGTLDMDGPSYFTYTDTNLTTGVVEIDSHPIQMHLFMLPID
jgi:hypothetical protein